MRRPVPDPAALLAAVAGRLDAVERIQAEAIKDVDALGRGVADLTGQLRRLAVDRPADQRTADDQRATDDLAAEPLLTVEDEDEGQPDWLTVTDPDLARDWLARADRWATDVLSRHGLDLAGTPCWPLHPAVPVDLLALAAQREHAYPQADPTAVAEWLTRWLPAGIARLRDELADCTRDRAHHHAGGLVDASGLTCAAGLDDVAAWWTHHRDAASGPEWLSLPPIR